MVRAMRCCNWMFLLAILFLSAVRCESWPGDWGNDHRRKEGGKEDFRNDAYNLQVALNLEFLEAEFFLASVYGYGLDKVAPELAQGGPPPRGAQKAELDDLTWDLTEQFGLQEVGHLREIRETLGDYYFSRPQLNIGKDVFADIVDNALGEKLNPRFDVYANPINFFLGVYVIPYVGLTGYVGAAPNLRTPGFRRTVAGLLGVEAGQDAVTRQYLYERKDDKVEPYNYNVAHFTNKISDLRNKLSRALVDEGLTLPRKLGAEGKVTGNILAGDKNSISYARTPKQIFSTVYSTGDPRKPGGFYPEGANGKLAESYLKTEKSFFRSLPSPLLSFKSRF